LILNEYKSFNLIINVTSTILQLADYIEIQKFFISNIGVNYPCVSIQSPTSFISSVSYPFSYGAGISLGQIDYYPIDTNNITASTVFIKFIKNKLENILLFFKIYLF
jgi:hypothetical protein